MAAPYMQRRLWSRHRLETILTSLNRPRSRSLILTRVLSAESVTKNDKVKSYDIQASNSINTGPSPTGSYSDNGRLGHFMQMYEDFVGLTEVKLAQAKVVDAEKQFLDVQEDRRAMQQDLVSIQTEVRSVGNDLEKTHRTDPGYIELVKKEHEILLVEKELTNKIKALDKAERDYFSLLSAAVRESHEKERARAERTKYWSVIGSVIGALIGITGSTWNNRVRLKEMRAIVTETGQAATEYKEVASKLLSSISFLQEASSEDFPVMVNKNENNNQALNTLSEDSLQHICEQTELITQCINGQTQVILTDLNDMKKILSIHKSEGDPKSVVYVGPDMKEMLEETKASLKSDGLKNLISVSAVGCILSVGLSLLVAYVKGS